MKTNKTIAYGLFAVIIALALAGCPDPDPTHTHDYGTEWKSNETQHWHECSCGEKTDVADHTAGDWIVDQAAAATIDGSRHKECTVCGYETETDTIPATGEGHIHDYGTEWKSNETQHWHECSCGEKTDLADHTAGDWIVDQTATATIAGSRHKECTFCGYETETETIPATGEGHVHDYSAEWSSNATQHWHECSCGEKADVANHTGDPCAICGYASGSQNPDLCECNGIAEDCDCVDCNCEVCEEEPPENQPPTANAGTDQTVTLAGNLTITLSGTGADSDGNITAYAWECASYTANQGAVSAAYTKAQVDALIANANKATATVEPHKAGTYVFKLTVTDDKGESDMDTITVVVEGYTVSATINIPNSAFIEGTTLNLNPTYSGWNSDFPEGCVTYTLRDNKGNNWDTTGIVVGSTYGSGFVDDVNLTQAFYYDNTEIASRSIHIEVDKGLISTIEKNGQMLFWDDEGADTAIPSVSLHLEKTITEIPPVSAHAQAAPTHTLANNLTITLNGTGSAGNISAYAWECVSYTANQGAVSAAYTKAQVDALIANANTATATIAPRKAGTYVFKLTVTGDEGESDTDTVAVVVGVAEVTVNLAQLDLSVGVPTSLNLTPTIGAGWENLNYIKLSFTLSETDEDGNVTTNYVYNNGVVSIPSGFLGHTWPPAPRITQNFSYEGKPIGSFHFNLRARNMGTYQFTNIYKWSEDNGQNSYTSFPASWTPLALTISEVE